MSIGTRRWIFLAAVVAGAAGYLWGLHGLPGFGRYPGPYGDLVNALSVGQRNATDVVTSVNFDYRGFDTIGEEFILFTAATGMAVVLRGLRGEQERSALDEARERRAPPTGDAVALSCLVFVAPVLLLGWEVVSHGQVSPGGGFQGGIVLATGFLLVYLAGQFITFHRLSPVAVIDTAEAVGAGGFAAIGVAALFFGLPYLTNVLPLGASAGAINSSGTIALISFFIGIEVAAGMALIVSELLEQTLLLRSGGESE